MIEYRSFLNTDATAIVEIWRSQPPSRVISSTVTRSDLDRMVFGKPYFDPAGLILAVDDGVPVGFAHCGFAPNADRTDLDHSVGMISQLRFRQGKETDEIAAELVRRSIEYLKSKGANSCYGGSQFPFAPFYLGMYGGSRVPGVADEDSLMMQRFLDAKFEKQQSVKVFQLRLSGYRRTVDRKQMQIRRQYSVTPIVDPKPPTWWDACTYGWHEIFGFWLVDKRSQEELGRATFWEIQPLSSEWGTRTMGLCDLRIAPEHQRKGLATFLVGESVRQITEQGASLIELQFLESDEAMDGLAKKLGFEQVSGGSVLQLPKV